MSVLRIGGKEISANLEYFSSLSEFTDFVVKDVKTMPKEKILPVIKDFWNANKPNNSKSEAGKSKRASSNIGSEPVEKVKSGASESKES